MSPTTLAPGGAGPDAEAAGGDRFVVHRPPRRHPEPLPTGEVVIAPPPPPRLQATGGWLVALLPVLGSGGSLLLLGTSGRRRWLLLAVTASLLLSLAAAAVPALRRRRAGRRSRDRYLDHLHTVAGTLARAAAVQRAAAGHLFPDLPGILAIAGGGERLWERRPADEDFLAVRVGRWTAPLEVPVRLDLGPDPLVERDPTLLAAARDLVRRASRLEALPLVVPLRRAGVVALTGPRAAARGLARFLLVQVAAFHAPGDVRILAAHPAADAGDWDWLKWLPHVRDRAGGPGTTAPWCLLASTAEQLSAHLQREVGPRLDRGARAGSGGSPLAHDPPTSAGPAHLLVVLDGFSSRGPLGRLAVLDEMLRRAADLDVTVLCLAGRRADEPSELRLRIELDGAGIRHCEAIARRLAPLRPAGQPDPGRVSSGAPVRLLELLGLDGPAALDPADAWRPRDRSGLLRIPIGLAGERGAHTADALVLDLKEAAEGGMGPHGMLIGATGSGKSELLRTIVTGLAITHPPELLSFVLVDFKGGAAFAGLETLPHTAGLITNLRADLAMVDRALAALRGELERRQRVLRLAGNLEDIGRYQSRRAADPALGPLPSLLLVVDEFGELLAARPEFLDLFIAVGRIGRSLGIHLLLASQRLDEGRIRGLESHLRGRMCLRTFAAADSVAVLGTTVAHTLPPHPGRGWLQVDGDTLPFVGATVSIDVDGGRRRRPPVAAIVPFEPGTPSATGPSSPAAYPRPLHPIVEPDQQLDAGTDMAGVVTALARAGPPGRRVDQVWLPPLPSTVTLGEVLAWVARDNGTAARPATGAWLRVPVGLVDRPREQVQEPLLLDLARAGGHLAVVGAPGSGKSTLLATIAAAFALTHAPDAVQLYCIDLGGGPLRELAGLPHVGAVCGPGERDKARHLVRELRALLAARERVPRALAADAALGLGPPDRQTQEPDGHGGAQVLLLVDNWARLREELPELEPEIDALAAAGLHHGVHLVVSANRWADLRLALRDNLGGRLELRLNDPLESTVGRAAAALPADTPGRGLTPTGLQFQAAIPAISAAPHETGAASEIVRRAVRSPSGAVAPALRMLPAVVHAADLPDDADRPPGAVPLGLHEHQLAPVWLDLLSGPPHFLVLGDAECGKTGVLRCLAAGLGALPPHRVRLTVIDYRRSLADLACLPYCGAYACTPAAAVAGVAGVHRAVERRSSPREPSAPRGWSGPHHMLLVDDYHLVTGGGSNPLEPLLDLVALGGDVGLNVVLACAAGGAARAAFDPFLRRLHEIGSPGVGDVRRSRRRAAAGWPAGRPAPAWPRPAHPAAGECRSCPGRLGAASPRAHGDRRFSRPGGDARGGDGGHDAALAPTVT
jgi:DNA segregation ATPase FtsK/SpoIIIE, S-DNA-T family